MTGLARAAIAARAPRLREDDMTNPITITTAPCCWGVDDVKNPHLPHWEKVLDEAQAAGFGGWAWALWLSAA